MRASCKIVWGRIRPGVKVTRAARFCTSSGASAPPPPSSGSSGFRYFGAGTVLGFISGAACAGELVRTTEDFKGKIVRENYKNSLPGQLGKLVVQEDLCAILEDEHVKNAFSISEVKQLFTVLPKEGISLWEFRQALQKLETAPLHYQAPEALEKKLKIIGKEMPQGAEKWHSARKISESEAYQIFRMFDLNGDGVVNAAEIITVLALFAKAHTPEEKRDKARLIFTQWDRDGDGNT